MKMKIKNIYIYTFKKEQMKLFHFKSVISYKGEQAVLPTNPIYMCSLMW